MIPTLRSMLRDHVLLRSRAQMPCFGRIVSVVETKAAPAAVGGGNIRRRSEMLRSAASNARARSAACASATAARCSAFASSTRSALISANSIPVPGRFKERPSARSELRSNAVSGNTLRSSDGSMENVPSSFRTALKRPDFIALLSVDLLFRVSLAACERVSSAMSFLWGYVVHQSRAFQAFPERLSPLFPVLQHIFQKFADLWTIRGQTLILGDAPDVISHVGGIGPLAIGAAKI